MTSEQWNSDYVTDAQREAMIDLACRSHYTLNELIERSFAPTDFTPYIGVPDWCGMFVGIEPDGHTHT